MIFIMYIQRALSHTTLHYMLHIKTLGRFYNPPAPALYEVNTRLQLSSRALLSRTRDHILPI